TRRTDARRPRNAVAGTEHHGVGLRVEDDAVPDGAAAAGLPPFAVPGLRGHTHHFIGGLFVGTVGRVARYRPEAPQFLARLGIERGEEAARIELATAFTDVHDAIADARRTGDGIGDVRIGDPLLPHLLAGLRIHGDHAAIERGPDDLAV